MPTTKHGTGISSWEFLFNHMPISKQATKKLRHDRARTKQNTKTKSWLTHLVKDARKSPSKDAFSKAFSALDKAVKNGMIHKNKADRTKSRMAKLLKK